MSVGPETAGGLAALGPGVADLASAGPVAEVRGRWLFYNNSSFDGNDPVADAADDAAIAPDKQALLPGAGTATFANYTSYSRGINGVMIDVAGLAGAALDVSDFAFRCGRSGDPAGWSAAPSPASIAVRPGAGTGGSDRITLIWDDGAIVNRQWLEITVLAGARTGLAANDVFYFGSAIGETGNKASEARVNSSDTTRIRNHFSSAAGVGLDNIYDLDRDGDVDADDVTVCRGHYSGFTPTALIAPPARPPAAPATVAGRWLFYNNSSFDGSDPAANAADDAAIAPDKQALLPGAGTATLANYTSYSRGINGVMVDVAGLVRATLDASDFVFRYGTGDDPSAWTAAASPASVTVRSGAGTGGSDRITLVWPDNAVPNGHWLQVTLLASARTGLEANDVFYFGCAIGETGNHPAEARVNSSDTTRIRNHFSGAGAAGIDSLYDLDRDGDVDAGDVTICRAHYSAFTPLLPITPPAVSPSPAAPAAVQEGRALDAGAAPEGDGRGASAAAGPLAQGGGSLGGTVFDDRDGNGLQEAGEPGLPDWTVYLDLNRDGQRNPGESAATTDASGRYVFADLAPGTYVVAEEWRAGWEQTSPGALPGVSAYAAGLGVGSSPVEMSAAVWPAEAKAAPIDAVSPEGALPGERPRVVVWPEPRLIPRESFFAGPPAAPAAAAATSSLTVNSDPEGDVPHQVAFTPDGQSVLLVNRDTDNLQVFDAATRGVLATIPVGDNPVDVAVTPDGRYALVPNVFGNSVSVVDLATDTVVATLPVADRPDEIRISPDGQWAYVTSLAGDGARHGWGSGLWLVASSDAEPDGQPNPRALGDDHGGLDDENGVRFATAFLRGRAASVVVTASAPGMLDAWIDFDADGDWSDPGEQVFASQPLAAGPNTLLFSVPAAAELTGQAFARFRLSSTGGLSFSGAADDGEVEDYQWTDAQAGYEFAEVPEGVYVVGEVLEPGWVRTWPSGGAAPLAPTPAPLAPASGGGAIGSIAMDSGPVPPADVGSSMPADVPPTAVMLDEVPTSWWTYGCSATAAGMIFGYYDRTGYPDMYTGPTNGGVAPSSSLGQGIGYPPPGSISIIATQQGFDGRIYRGHVDDYWVETNAIGPNPWENTWTEHAWSGCTADFMGTSQWKWDLNGDAVRDRNADGVTTLFYYSDLPDKEALLPGGGKAAFKNYTSFSRGLNGIMVDVAGLPAATLAAADCAFTYGNGDTPADWLAAADPTTIAVRPGAGAGGSDRVTLIWADNAIPNGNWLRVAVKANDHTGLAADDVFCFGSAIGETGNSTADAKVNSSDVTRIRNNYSGFGTVGIESVYDFNRDRKVNSQDVTICRNHDSGFTPLKLITPPAGSPGPEAVPAALDAVLSQDPAPWAGEAYLDLVWVDAVASSRSKRNSSEPDALLQAVEQRLPL